ncbi:MAG TPA: hypothetical protein VF089_02220, partial [Candidatus Binatia bacterium]
TGDISGASCIVDATEPLPGRSDVAYFPPCLNRRTIFLVPYPLVPANNLRAECSGRLSLQLMVASRFRSESG